MELIPIIQYMLIIFVTLLGGILIISFVLSRIHNGKSNAGPSARTEVTNSMSVPASEFITLYPAKEYRTQQRGHQSRSHQDRSHQDRSRQAGNRTAPIESRPFLQNPDREFLYGIPADRNEEQYIQAAAREYQHAQEDMMSSRMQAAEKFKVQNKPPQRFVVVNDRENEGLGYMPERDGSFRSRFASSKNADSMIHFR